MGNLSESFDIKDLMSYGDDLISLLNAKNGFDVVSQSFEDLKALRLVCDEDFNQTQRSIQGQFFPIWVSRETWKGINFSHESWNDSVGLIDCKKKLVACKKKTEEAYSDVSVGDDVIERLQKELDEEMELECKLKDELRVVADELKDLNAQWTSVDEQRQSIKRKERDDLRAEKKLSMYASVTKVIPDVEEYPLKISGYMVDREKKVIEKFQFETNKMTAYETCNSIWSIINKQQ